MWDRVTVEHRLWHEAQRLDGRVDRKQPGLPFPHATDVPLGIWCFLVLLFYVQGLLLLFSCTKLRPGRFMSQPFCHAWVTNKRRYSISVI